MRVVIDIDEEYYDHIKSQVTEGVDNPLKICIANGIPLPKGHGKLGDLDVLRKEVSSWGMNDYEPSDFIDVIDQADTIIKADKAESEPQESEE